MSKILSERISLLLKQKGMSQKELASRAGVTEAAISHYLKGDRTPRTSALACIADVLETTTDYLIGGEEENEIKSATRLIARNVHHMTKEEKMEIINLLMTDK